MSALQPDEKVCPFCAEVIKAAAVKCRYCQSDLTDAGARATAAPVDSPADSPGAVPADSAVTEGEQRDGDLVDPSTADDAGQGDPPPPPPPSDWNRDAGAQRVPFLASLRLLVGLVALCLVLSCVLAFAWWRSENPDEGAAPDGAITSTEARNAGMQEAAELTEKVLSYDWKTLDADNEASQAVLAPSFRSEYSKTMAGVKAEAVKNQVTLKAKAEATSIVSATENKVVALVFVNQETTAKGTSNRRVDSSRVLVTLTRSGGDWRISKLKAF
jgi:hypothetical protein